MSREILPEHHLFAIDHVDATGEGIHFVGVFGEASISTRRPSTAYTSMLHPAGEYMVRLLLSRTIRMEPSSSICPTPTPIFPSRSERLTRESASRLGKEHPHRQRRELPVCESGSLIGKPHSGPPAALPPMKLTFRRRWSV